MTNNEIKTVGQTIAAETQIGGNTAARVGGVIEGIGVALDNKDAADGYYQATISGGTITVNAPNYLLGSGGNLRIKMPSAGTTASTLTIGNANSVQLWYNGAAVSSMNTWKAGEIISVFYDGIRFMASNSQGGGSELKVNDTDTGDLEFADEYNHSIVRFSEGHVKTKNFDSKKDAPLSGENTDTGDLEFADEHNHSIVRFSEGHVKTKNFDSAQIDNILAKFNGKSLGIIGDSISTFRGWLPSDISGYDGTTYATYYPHSPLTSVEQTWWYKVASHLGINVTRISNCSWSGSRVSGDSTSIDNAYAGCSTKRITDLAARGFIPDIIIIFISCNDWGNNPVVPVGTWQVSDAIPNEGVITTMREAYALMLNKIHTTYPQARVFCCTNLDDFSRDATSGWPSNNSQGVSTYQWNQNIKEIAEAFGCDVIDVHSCGINYSNIHDYYAVDAGLHPNDAGHTLIANRVISELKKKF